MRGMSRRFEPAPRVLVEAADDWRVVGGAEVGCDARARLRSEGVDAPTVVERRHDPREAVVRDDVVGGECLRALDVRAPAPALPSAGTEHAWLGVEVRVAACRVRALLCGTRLIPV